MFWKAKEPLSSVVLMRFVKSGTPLSLHALQLPHHAQPFVYFGLVHLEFFAQLVQQFGFFTYLKGKVIYIYIGVVFSYLILYYGPFLF